MDREALVRSSLEAWNRNDWAALEATWDPDGEAVAPEGWPEAGSFRGWPAIRDQFRRLKGSWSAERVEVDSVESAGDQVMAVVRWVTRGESSGMEFEARVWALFSFADRRISRVEYFLDAGAARAVTAEARR